MLFSIRGCVEFGSSEKSEKLSEILIFTMEYLQPSFNNFSVQANKNQGVQKF